MYFKGMYVCDVYLTHSSCNDPGTTLGQVPKTHEEFGDRGFAAPQSQSCQD